MTKEKRKKEFCTAERTFFALGTMNHIKIMDSSQEEVIDLAVNRVLEIEEHMSAFLPNSDIYQINKNAGVKFTKVHKDTMHVLQCGKKYSEWSKGAFDMTIRPLVALWGIGKKQNEIPDQKEIQRTIRLVNYKDMIENEKTREIKLKHKHQELDLGGIAKGYAADEVKRILKENGVKRAIINLGGNIVTLSDSESVPEWRIGIQNPLAPTGNYVGVLHLHNKTVVTSGVNERFFMKDRVRYHHLLDPKTGRPSNGNLLSVSVVADTSMEADAASTSLFLNGMENGCELLRKTGMEAIFLTTDGGIYVTGGLRSSFEIAEKQNPANQSLQFCRAV